MDEQLLVYWFHCVEVSHTVLLWCCLLLLTNLASDQLPYFIITAIHLPVVGSYSCITVLSIFIYAVTCAWSLLYSHMHQMCIFIDVAIFHPCLQVTVWVSPQVIGVSCSLVYTTHGLLVTPTIITQSMHWPVTIHVCPRHTPLGYIEYFHTNVEARFVMSM